jgi:phosphoribosyl-AMP cyclohydrolase
VRAAAGFDTQDAIFRKGAASGQVLSVFLRVDVVCDDGHLVGVAQVFAQCIDERCLA